VEVTGGDGQGGGGHHDRSEIEATRAAYGNDSSDDSSS
jgi:hypothetical protein